MSMVTVWFAWYPVKLGCRREGGWIWLSRVCRYRYESVVIYSAYTKSRGGEIPMETLNGDEEKVVLSSANETKLFGFPRGVKKPKILSEKERFDFLTHFDEELKEYSIKGSDMIPWDEDSLTACRWTSEELSRIYANEKIAPLPIYKEPVAPNPFMRWIFKD